MVHAVHGLWLHITDAWMGPEQELTHFQSKSPFSRLCHITTFVVRDLLDLSLAYNIRETSMIVKPLFVDRVLCIYYLNLSYL